MVITWKKYKIRTAVALNIWCKFKQFMVCAPLHADEYRQEREGAGSSLFFMSFSWSMGNGQFSAYEWVNIVWDDGLLNWPENVELFALAKSILMPRDFVQRQQRWVNLISRQHGRPRSTQVITSLQVFRVDRCKHWGIIVWLWLLPCPRGQLKNFCIDPSQHLVNFVVL